MLRHKPARYYPAAAIIICVSLHFAWPLSAQVLAPSWRGATGSTWQEWTFSTNTNPMVPDGSSNLFGTASASLSLGANASDWFYNEPAAFGNATGFWSIGATGRFDITIPDYGGPTTNGIKELRVQVVQYIEAGFFGYATVDVTSANILSLTHSNRLVLSAPFGEWRVDDWSFTLEDGSQPDLISILNPALNRDTLIDWIVVDTLVIPEPRALFICMSAGAVALVGRRRLRPTH